MEQIKKIMYVILGSLIIALSLNLFFFPYKLIPTGIFGFSTIFSLKTNIAFSISLLLATLLIFSVGCLTLSVNTIKKVTLPTFLIVIFTYLTSNITNLIDLEGTDMLLITIFGGSLIGIGGSLIYKEGFLVGANDIISHIAMAILGEKGGNINIVIDCIIILFTVLNFGYEVAMYSSLAIIIIEIMNKKSIIGISDTKMFYIITKEESKVKKFIMDELHCDLTIYDVKGGYSKTKNRVLMSAISTKDYYKLREKIKEIDRDAFIAITDAYEVINENLMVNL